MIWKLFTNLLGSQSRLTQSAQSTQPPQITQSSQPATFDTSRISLSFLEKLIPIGSLGASELQNLPLTIRSFNPGEVIFNRGESNDQLSYLYRGEVFLDTLEGNGFNVEESVFRACYPLSNHNQHSFTAIAKAPTEILYLPLAALRRSSDLANHQNPLINPDDVPAELLNCRLFSGICNAFRNNELRVPSLPDVALRLRNALHREIDIVEVSKIINLDPAIASRLVQVANSPLYRTSNPSSSCHDAVNRLGLKATQSLVTSISMQNLFLSSNQKLNRYIQQLWRQSIQVAAISQTLAALTHKADADEALLAGLIHNIGALPIINYAETLDEGQWTAQQLQHTINILQPRLGKQILKKWDFPKEMMEIPLTTSHWFHDGAPTLQLSDIVLLARFHAQLGQSQTLPPLNALPAFAKLGENALSPDMSLKILQDAKQQIAEAINFFRS